MNPYVAAALIGLALGLAYCGIQILCIHVGFVRRRRARRAEWERERPYRDLRRAFDDVEFAGQQIRDIEGLHRRGILTDKQAADLIAPIRTDQETAVKRLNQARAVVDEQIASLQ